MTSTSLISIVATAVLIFWVLGAYNRLVRLKNTIANAVGQIDVHLKRRHDSVPNLLEAVRAHLSLERETLEAVSNARHQAQAASEAARGRPANAQALTTLALAEQALTSSLGKLFALSEAHPELKADETIRALSEELTSSENKAAFAREAFNDAVLSYNHARAQFPTVLVARLFSFAPAALFTDDATPARPDATP